MARFTFSPSSVKEWLTELQQHVRSRNREQSRRDSDMLIDSLGQASTPVVYEGPGERRSTSMQGIDTWREMLPLVRSARMAIEGDNFDIADGFLSEACSLLDSSGLLSSVPPKGK